MQHEVRISAAKMTNKMPVVLSVDDIRDEATKRLTTTATGERTTPVVLNASTQETPMIPFDNENRCTRLISS